MTTDPRRRLWPAVRSGGAAGCPVGLRVGVTQGPVGDLRERSPSSWSSSTDNSFPFGGHDDPRHRTARQKSRRPLDRRLSTQLRHRGKCRLRRDHVPEKRIPVLPRHERDVGCAEIVLKRNGMTIRRTSREGRHCQPLSARPPSAWTELVSPPASRQWRARYPIRPAASPR